MHSKIAFIVLLGQEFELLQQHHVLGRKYGDTSKLLLSGQRGPLATILNLSYSSDIMGILDGEEVDIGFFGMRKNYIR